MWALGVIIIGAGGWLIWSSKKSEQKAKTMEAAKTTTVEEIQKLVQEIREQLNGGVSGYTEYVELKGLSRCEQPLTGEFSKEPAAIIRTKVERQIETRRERRDDDGNIRTSWHKSTDVLQKHEEEAEFFIEDSTGRARVISEGSELHLIERVNRFEPPGSVERQQGNISWGNFSMSLSSYRGNDRRTLGYKFEEKALPVDHQLYVLGEIRDTEGGLVIQKPSDNNKGKPFIVSARSEAELVASAESSAKTQKFGGIAAIVIGLVVLVYGIMELL